jgi:3-dehydro-L-gulonate 2-dehydrogenase
MITIPFDKLKQEMLRVLIGLDFSEGRAEDIAEIFASNSRDGVNSHGLNRFPLFVQYVKEGLVNKDAIPVLEKSIGAIERWDGNLGPGVLNAKFSMNRAMTLAQENGIGCVALRNTNHWMRGGTYGWQAAEEGFIGICFTNTIANMPPWGGKTPRLGNNPLIIAIPRKEGHLVLDIAMSQYSYGKLNEYKIRDEVLPYEGGFNSQGFLSKKPAEIIESQRTLPIGLWKGSGLSLMLDLLVTMLSEGKSTSAISKTNREYGISQVFICISPLSGMADTAPLIEEIISFTKSSVAESQDSSIAYPGENTLRTRIKNLREGIPVDEVMWEALQNL